MKQNGNNLRTSPYYIGLDVGTNSVGWAVAEKDYSIPRFKGQAMWGARLFEEAKTAADRRTARTARRRLARKKQRLFWLEMLFSDEIGKIDPMFFRRLHESALFPEDKSAGTGKYTLFNDEHFTDRDYLKKYPTVYHLRRELIRSTEPHDIRLVYLALHHIIKSRGHFLFAGSGDSDYITLDAALDEFSAFLSSEYDISFALSDRDSFLRIMSASDMSVTQKKKELAAFIEINDAESPAISLKALAELMAGATVKLASLYNDDTLKKSDPSSVCLRGDLDEVYDKLCDALGSRVELLLQLKNLFDIARLAQILGNSTYLCEAKVVQYERNAADLRLLKEYVRTCCPEKYKLIFSQRKEKLNNYVAYSRYQRPGGGYSCNQEDFCKFLDKELGSGDVPEAYRHIREDIRNKTLLPRLKGSDNGVIPNQLQRRELVKILDNASAYLTFLSAMDENGKTVREKIIDIFDFRIPYYVGPLNSASPNAWLVRKDEKIYPWNFSDVVDTESSAVGFMDRLIGRCTYTAEPVLPADSLLYSEFSVLNEINPLSVDGHPLPVSVKQDIYRDLFLDSNKKVTKKRIRDYLVSRGLATLEAEIGGIDDTIKSSLRSHHDFKRILEKTGDKEMVESIIRGILIYSDDKKMLCRWLKKNYSKLDANDIQYISRLKYADWGRLSAEFLTQIYSSVNEQGEAMSIIEAMRSTNDNLMQLLSDRYDYKETAEAHRKEITGEKSIHDRLSEMYIAPSVRRSIWQTLRIVDELVDIRGGAPEKIFIEVARGDAEEVKKKRTESRKSKLLDLYRQCGEDSSALFEQLSNEEESRLRQDKLYLYYTQFGKCMYSGELIDLSVALADNSTYDIDHIYPRSRIKDDSLDNRVLVKSTLNREKTNEYPIKEDIRAKMLPFWTMLHSKKLISDEKMKRLKRSYALTDEELSSFVARQLVETRQSTKALAVLLQEIYPETKLVYSKAKNVSDFRQQFHIYKCRAVNDLHHARDAYLNIVVGNVYDTKFTEKFFRNIHRENYSLSRVFDFDTPDAWDKEHTIITVKKYVSKSNAIVTRMPHETEGQLFDLQIMPAGKGQLSVKEGLPIEKYGGYNKLSGAYFFVAEHTDKKKRIRSMLPVYIYKKGLYERDPLGYCKDILHLTDPQIIAPCIRTDALLELDGLRLNISGRTGRQIIYKHSYQLAADEQRSDYIKALGKFVERYSHTESAPSGHDHVSSADNLALYDWFCEKLRTPQYNRLFSLVLSDMEANREKFISLPLLAQAQLLLEILKTFTCDAQHSNFDVLCGKGAVGIILRNAKLNGLCSACLIHQSVTGLFETKTDLLH